MRAVPEAAPIFALRIAGLLQTNNSPANWLCLSQGRTKEYMRWSPFNVSTSILAFICGLPFGPVGVASGHMRSRSRSSRCFRPVAEKCGATLAPVADSTTGTTLVGRQRNDRAC
ncbi:protein of unknown function [Bradyrhizobium vignae]|uniref:Uncharacterized protein n=1 Tax=Bradyrhizobium vignae TaxID=1549949 RepID=A0A2U3QDM1_9BRAD|nr:protein of unknown function [Bradyrhizobium vignae]